MKSQDIGVLLKLVSLQRAESERVITNAEKAWPHDWRDWNEEAEFDYPADLAPADEQALHARYTARALEQQTGISKTQINLALTRCIEIGLAHKDRRLGIPRANTRALADFIVHGLKYVFPARPAELTRGIATGFAAPILRDKLLSAGEYMLVWPDAHGNSTGQAVEPLFKTAVYAARKDPEIYALLALIDAIRLGQPRENQLAAQLLRKRLDIVK
ncbi:hypothetical protein [Stutzerimonas kunmingensis]|uniref:hypothetical protein n=1 Tax=Stutzerimonas kunmingensis TaxID=1211807 RepID=UPI0028A5A620|nr:hypothetical protein [Stutzerimonas kunmingensis]